MTGKHIAVFGIYQTRNQAERSVDDLLASRFCSRKTRAPKILLMRRIQGRQKVPLPELPPAVRLVELLACWLGSALWRFPELARLLRPVPLWALLRASESAARSAA